MDQDKACIVIWVYIFNNLIAVCSAITDNTSIQVVVVVWKRAIDDSLYLWITVKRG